MSDMFPRAKKIAERYAEFQDRTPQEQELYDFARFYLAYGELVAAQADAIDLLSDGYEDVDFTEVDAASDALKRLINE